MHPTTNMTTSFNRRPSTDKRSVCDNVFAGLWQQIGIKTLVSRAGFTMCSGVPIHEVLYVLSLWLLLKKESIGLFARKSLQIAMGNGCALSPEKSRRPELNRSLARPPRRTKRPAKKPFQVRKVRTHLEKFSNCFQSFLENHHYYDKSKVSRIGM